VALVAAGCGSDAGAGGDRVLVVATTTQLADFARVVGGDAVEVHGLLRPNVDAHDFDPSPADLDALARADVIVANGVGLEPWLEGAVEASGTSTEITDASTGALLITGEDGDHDHGLDGEADHEDDEEAETGADDHGHTGANPHIWLDPENARVMAGNVADAIATAVPDAAAGVEERARVYDEELVALDAEIRDLLADLPDRLLVTDHDAFPYFAAHYDLEVVGSIIPSFDSAAEISAGDLQDLADAIEAEGVRAVFTEQSLPSDAADALARLVDVTVVSGDEGLYADSLGPAGSPGATYLQMMRHNASTLERHLG
jgi:zinc/manganese transport system substrate-binding protein/manganese/iron transport system substrate-binding protein